MVDGDNTYDISKIKIHLNTFIKEKTRYVNWLRESHPKKIPTEVRSPFW